ncbi:recombinase family protein [Enterococcus sp.]|uniref:recombinase family protein n=1 Tax=Enterococcus sp. TaxID=35783 RepID=UPI002898D11B|nr:recombinase family protein [Enterococcus sp.]
MTKYGYARISTTSQSTKEQIQQLLENDVKKKNIFSEKFTGTKRDRPKFNQLLAGLKPGDEIVVTKLDRFARNTREALEIIEPLLDETVTIKVLNLGTIENTLMGKMIVRILRSIAEMERAMIVERTQEGKIFAKKNNPNFKEGRPKATITPKKHHAYELLISGKSYKEVEAITRFSRSTLFRIKKKIEEDE